MTAGSWQIIKLVFFYSCQKCQGYTKWNELSQGSFVKSFLLFAGFKINTTGLYQRRVNRI